MLPLSPVELIRRGARWSHRTLVERYLRYNNYRSWIEVGVRANTDALTPAESSDREWLCRYPRSIQVVHDLGTEFTKNFRNYYVATVSRQSQLLLRPLRQTPFASEYTSRLWMRFAVTKSPTGQKLYTMLRSPYALAITVSSTPRRDNSCLDKTWSPDSFMTRTRAT